MRGSEGADVAVAGRRLARSRRGAVANPAGATSTPALASASLPVGQVLWLARARPCPGCGWRHSVAWLKLVSWSPGLPTTGCATKSAVVFRPRRDAVVRLPGSTIGEDGRRADEMGDWGPKAAAKTCGC